VCVHAPRGHRRNASRAGPSRERSIVRILIFRTILDYHSASLRSVNNCGWRYWKSTVTDVIAPSFHRPAAPGWDPPRTPRPFLPRASRVDAALSLSLFLSLSLSLSFSSYFPSSPSPAVFFSPYLVASIRLRYRARSFRDAEVRGALQGVHVNSLYGPDIHPPFASRLSSVTRYRCRPLFQAALFFSRFRPGARSLSPLLPVSLRRVFFPGSRPLLQVYDSHIRRKNRVISGNTSEIPPT